MTVHEPSAAPHGREAREACDAPPTMHQLLASCAAATAVSTPPEAPATAAVPPAEPDHPTPSATERDAA
ncbi:hypothetical protein OG422_12775 [Streptomyces sp. NBC_01525]|uniref:Uncharacterized protein n=1 Tax=Streptomyces benahoarensis TaxID=2595054 RepID=A0A553Z377_9ACTN|nr:hypothetical protein [Streptomyces benahoarensis]TSB18552.1 hypothetical protein FNJ62_24000 [Streptomyces benahoarensis]TSB35926.1 hypothetical protein FNZ23_20415 [Streptomyces benahoarensis]